MQIQNAAQLRSAIDYLESEKETKRSLMIGQFHDTCDGLRPINLIKDAVATVVDSPGIVKNIVGTSIGVSAGILSKKLLVGKSTNIFKKLLGTAIQLLVSTTVARKI